MYEKILISSKLKVLTGLHIGGSSIFSSIGAVDSPVVVDKKTQRPIIPGSSLKGKLRTLLVRNLADKPTDIKEPNSDPVSVKRLFGASAPKIEKARLQFADAYISKSSLEELEHIGFTEVKFENAIQRSDLVANPRQIERVISGVCFDVRIVYDWVNDEMEEDMRNLAKAMKLLQMDYLGGHGTRGSGRISFTEIGLQRIKLSEDAVADENDIQKIQKISEIFKEVESYELLSV